MKKFQPIYYFHLPIIRLSVVDPCLFKVLCLIEVSSKFMQEKATIYLVFLIRIKSGKCIFSAIRVNCVCMNFGRVKGCTASNLCNKVLK